MLICPSSRPGVEYLSALAPLAAIPLLGESLVEYWMTHLAMSGPTSVRILASDRPERIAAIVGNGARWGLQAEVIVENRELTLAQAQIKYSREISSGSSEIVVLDHFPGTLHSLFTSYADLFGGVLEWLPNAFMPDRVGFREIRPGVWAGLHTRISPEAHLNAPCWLGHNVFVGAGAVVGPMTIVEDRCFIESKAEVVSSLVGPDTFVGEPAVIGEAIAWGNSVIGWKTGACMKVQDAFVLCALRRSAVAPSNPSGLFTRLSETYVRNKEELQMFWKNLVTNKEG
ncbi:MAG TPA: hypothetical protein PLK78_12175 [Verrucomicrobiota bacterium]|nr:hypothetical protein [Verrucomicrobiota bacterium]